MRISRRWSVGTRRFKGLRQLLWIEIEQDQLGGLMYGSLTLVGLSLVYLGTAAP